VLKAIGTTMMHRLYTTEATLFCKAYVEYYKIDQLIASYPKTVTPPNLIRHNDMVYIKWKRTTSTPPPIEAV